MKRRGFYVFMGIMVFLAIVNVIAWKSAAFCDCYIRYVYPIWLNTYGRITGGISFSVGEIMLITGLILSAAALPAGIVFIAASLLRKTGFRKKTSNSLLIRVCGVYLTGYVWLFTGVLTVMTFNCFIPYHCSPIESKYGLISRMSADDPVLMQLLAKNYTVEELGRLRDYVVIKTNALARQVERDENGTVIFPENMEEKVIESMLSLGKDCEQLKGYYPRPKKLTFSGFFSQQKMKGYFFPFSMEANYNGLMYEVNRPATICHEYAHLKGFLMEDEANLIGFLACANSPEISFQYSGYLSILNYVNNEFYEAIGGNQEIYASHVSISPQVKAENVFLKEETWKKVEEKAVLKTETVDKVSDKITETALVINGVEDGILSYTRVVGLLLHYYDGSAEVEQLLQEPEFLVQSED